MGDTPTVTVAVTIKRDDWGKSLEVVGGSWSDVDPGTLYELHKPGGLHVDRVPCDNCEGDQIVPTECCENPPCGHNVPCPSCVDGYKWPNWALETVRRYTAPHRNLPSHLFDVLIKANQ